MDLEKLAVDAVARAMNDYIALNGQDEPFVKAFLQYAWVHRDGKKIMDEFSSVPERLKPKR